MKLMVSILMIVTVMELQVGNSLTLYKNGLVQYSTNILHKSQSHPNRQGRSYTNYHFEPTDTIQVSKKPKVFPEVVYVQDLQQSTNNNPQYQYLPPEERQNNNDHQLFNVGYTISFANNMQRQQNKQSRQLEDDIVIGTQGPQMPRPRTNGRTTGETTGRTSERTTGRTNGRTNGRTTEEEIVLNEFLDNKKRKLSGIKPKYYRPLSHGLDTKYLIEQANLSPKTQKKLEALQIDYEATTMMPTNKRWISLSPSVEIFRSDGIYNNKEQMEQAKKFDHAKALQKSLAFDHTNAINAQDVTDINSNLGRSYVVQATPKYIRTYLPRYQ